MSRRYNMLKYAEFLWQQLVKWTLNILKDILEITDRASSRNHRQSVIEVNWIKELLRNAISYWHYHNCLCHWLQTRYFIETSPLHNVNSNVVFQWSYFCPSFIIFSSKGRVQLAHGLWAKPKYTGFISLIRNRVILEKENVSLEPKTGK